MKRGSGETLWSHSLLGKLCSQRDTGRVWGLVGCSRKCRGSGSGTELKGERARTWEEMKLEKAGQGRLLEGRDTLGGPSSSGGGASHAVLVCLGCCNKKSQTGCSQAIGTCISQFWRLEVQGQGANVTFSRRASPWLVAGTLSLRPHTLEGAGCSLEPLL